MSSWYERVSRLPRSVYAAMARSGAKLATLFSDTDFCDSLRKAEDPEAVLDVIMSRQAVPGA